MTKFVAILLGALLCASSKPLIESLPTISESPWEREIGCLYSAVWWEARGESDIGKKAVMDVVLNRARLRKQSICDIISAPHQFAWYHRGISLKVDEKVLTQYNGVARMDAVVDNNTEYFHSKGRPAWTSSMSLVHSIGNHKFYKSKGNK